MCSIKTLIILQQLRLMNLNEYSFARGIHISIKYGESNMKNRLATTMLFLLFSLVTTKHGLAQGGVS